MPQMQLRDVSKKMSFNTYFEMSLRRCMTHLRDASKMYPCRLGTGNDIYVYIYIYTYIPRFIVKFSV